MISQPAGDILCFDNGTGLLGGVETDPGFVRALADSTAEALAGLRTPVPTHA